MTNSKVKINYNDTFGTMHSRDYYRGASFHFSGKWISGAHYVSDDYNIDFVVHGQALLACAKSHLSSLDNEPTKFITDESGTIIGVISTYWDFVLSGIVGNSPGVKIIDNYWYICKNTGVPEEEQVWENTGVKAKMELSDLSPEEIALLQEPGKQVVTEFVNNTITQETGQNIDKIMSQKAVTDELSNKPTKGEMAAAFINAKQISDLTYQPKGDYATNTRVNSVETGVNDRIDSVEDDLDDAVNTLTSDINDVDEKVNENTSNITTLNNDLSDEILSRQSEDSILLGKIQTEIENRQTGDYINAQAISEINSKIPSEATAFNQLADKDFVHNEISTSSATFRGTYNTLVELEVQEADNNDYGFVVHTDALGNTIYSRYKYNGTEWLWEYDITSTEFSQSQWEAVNSGINSTLVTKLSDLPTNADLTAALNNKVDKVTGKALSKINDIVVADANSEKTMTISKNDGSSDLVVDLGAKFSAAEKTKLSGIESNAQVNILEGVQVNGTDLQIANKKVNVDISGKVDKVSGKGLSTNDYTNNEKTKLEALPTKAELDTALDAKVDKAGNESETSEFVFRQTGSGLDIEAKNARIESFKGKTLAWNQLVKNGNFAEGTTNWFSGFGSIAVSGGILTYTVNTPTTGPTLFQSNFPDIVNHKYLFAAELNYSVKPTPISGNSGFLGIGGYYGVNWDIQSIVPNSWFKVSGIITSNGDAATKDLRIYLRTIGMSAGDTVQIKNVIAIDLTLMFGAGHEPSTVAEFEAMYPGYHAYNPGDLISNDAEALETVGFNKWDEELEEGYLGYSSDNMGQPISTSVGAMRSKNFVRVIPNTAYYLSYAPNTTHYVWTYDAKKNAIRLININPNSGNFTTPADCYYIKFCTEPEYGTTYKHDICINISDPSRNGQYEPYRKSILPLNLNKIRVISPNVWDEEWEAGTYNTSGEKAVNTERIRSANYIPVNAGGSYYAQHPNTDFVIYEYDANKQFISGSNRNVSGSFTVGNTTRYITFWIGQISYSNDICINKSDPGFNGKYFPHGILTITTGLNGVGDSYDSVEKGMMHKRRARVNLGDLAWSIAYDSQNNVVFSTEELSSLIKSTLNDSLVGNIICSIYSTVSRNGEWGSGDDMVIAVNRLGAIFVNNYAYTDAASFKTAMDGVYLDYELANKEIYELAEPLRTDYIVDKLGTERVIAESPICPFRADIHYYESSVKDIEIENMPQYLKREELTDELDKLQDIESGAQVNTIEHIKINDTEQTISNKTVNLPAYPTSLPASDVSEWAKASTKPGYNFSEIGGSVANSQLPSSISIENITASGQLSGNAFKVIAEHIAKLTSRIETLENGIGVTDTLSSTSVDSANGYYINGDKTVIVGSGAPTVVPAFAGQFYINTSGPALYYAVNNSATTDWKQA